MDHWAIEQTTFDRYNTRLVWYSDPHYMCFLKVQFKVFAAFQGVPEIDVSLCPPSLEKDAPNIF